MITSKHKALIAATAASDKKGIDIVTIKMRKVSGICDYFVIASGTSTTHVRAISDNIVRKLIEKGSRPRHIEGAREASWVLADFGDVVAHVFLEDKRKFYDLEKLWSIAPKERFAEKPAKASKKKAVRKAKKRKSAAKRQSRPVKRIVKKAKKRIVKKTSRRKSR